MSFSSCPSWGTPPRKITKKSSATHATGTKTSATRHQTCLRAPSYLHNRKSATQSCRKTRRSKSWPRVAPTRATARAPGATPSTFWPTAMSVIRRNVTRKLALRPMCSLMMALQVWAQTWSCWCVWWWQYWWWVDWLELVSNYINKWRIRVFYTVLSWDVYCMGETETMHHHFFNSRIILCCISLHLLRISKTPRGTNVLMTPRWEFTTNWTTWQPIPCY